MDTFNKLSGGDDHNKSNSNSNPHQSSSNSHLMSSAKVVAEAAQLAANKQSNKIDKHKVAGATADLLDAAKKHHMFDETQGVGKYLNKADGYLHKYANK
ncbi:hypothetical protein QVD17_31733 [Tagetes erecta]|uniref:Uncharacterized protein n=1 Tax=Tagetes erecta TaxID=13708 RepID=A0AAD8KAG4_TARER|nr:hypothetical protein QVD17_31733 [Tagetes erecta]